jgi:hypothetical protein
VTPSKASASNGSSVPVTITLESALPAQTTGGTFEPFLIASLGTGTTYHLWPGMVVAPQ